MTDRFSQKYDHPAIHELRRLFPSREVEAWVERWLMVKKETQGIVDSDTLWSENEDLVKYALAARLGEDMVEDSIDFKKTKNRIECKALVLRRR